MDLGDVVADISAVIGAEESSKAFLNCSPNDDFTDAGALGLLLMNGDIGLCLSIHRVLFHGQDLLVRCL